MSPTGLSPLHARMSTILHARESELRRILDVDDSLLAEPQGPQVLDFKDLAAEQAAASIEDVTAAHAAAELTQVLAALRRLDKGNYGSCTDCGEPIDERRLLAMPATPFCTACQEVRERSIVGRLPRPPHH